MKVKDRIRLRNGDGSIFGIGKVLDVIKDMGEKSLVQYEYKIHNASYKDTGEILNSDVMQGSK